MTPSLDPEKPPFEATWILMASHVVPSTAFKVWVRTWPLDSGPRGCYASVELIGALTGTAARTVEELRRWLADAGLLLRVSAGRYAGWKVRFPAECLPSEKKPAFEVVKALAARLDGILMSNLREAEARRLEAQATRDPVDYESTFESTPPTANPVISRSLVTPIAGGAFAREGVGDESSLRPKGLKDQPLTLALLQISDGGKEERPAVDSQQGTEREKKEGPDSPEWRKAMNAAWMPQHGAKKDTA